MGVTFQRKPKVSKQCGSGMRAWFIMAGCFPEFRHRTSSFDLHTLATANRLAKIGKLFRSRSDDAMKVPGSSPKNSPKGGSPTDSPKDSPKGSPQEPPRRRFMRVVRNNQNQGEEYVNPHVIRKYNHKYIQEEQTRLHLQKSKSLEEGDKPLPYTVSGHTILKKHPSLDIEPSPKPQGDKHACFKEEVEILAYDKKGHSEIMHDKLNDSEDEDFYSATSREIGSEDSSPDPDDADLLEEVGDVFEDCDENNRLSSLEPIPETKSLEILTPRDVSPSAADRRAAKDIVDSELCASVDQVHLDADDIIVTDKDVARTFVATSSVLRTTPLIETQS